MIMYAGFEVSVPAIQCFINKFTEYIAASSPYIARRHNIIVLQELGYTLSSYYLCLCVYEEANKNDPLYGLA